jgi:putative aldouronate transport system substrate-binding protein
MVPYLFFMEVILMSEEKNALTAHDLLSRRRFMSVAAATAGGTLLAACGTSTPAQPTRAPVVATLPPQSVAATSTASVGKTYFPSGDPNVPDAFTAPLPPFQSVFYVPGNGDTVKVLSVTSQPPVTPKSSNKYWQGLEKHLNVTWDADLVTADVYPEKISTTLAGGDVPDLFMIDPVNGPGIYQPILQGAFTDLTPFVTGKALQDYPNLARIAPLTWQNSKINGKYYMVPRSRPLTGYALLYRKDWAEKVGIPNPQNANDFLKLMQAFSKKNLDGGSGSTWGMGFTTDASLFATNHCAFFYGIFNVPNLWRKESNGSMTYFIQTDEFKQAVSFMRQMFAAGLFYPSSLTQSGQDLKDNFSAGKYGAYMDTITGLPDQTIKLLQVHPNAQLSVLTPFPANGSQANHWMGTGYNAGAGIPSAVGGDENRVKELLRILDYIAAPYFSIEFNYLYLGVDSWDNTTNTNGLKIVTPRGQNEIGDLANIANPSFAYYTPQVTANPQLPVQEQEFTRNLLKISVQNPTLGLFSPTQAKQGAVLQALVSDRVLRIVRGTDPLSAISSLISDWQSQGGAQIAKEIGKS